MGDTSGARLVLRWWRYAPSVAVLALAALLPALAFGWLDAWEDSSSGSRAERLSLAACGVVLACTGLVLLVQRVAKDGETRRLRRLYATREVPAPRSALTYWQLAALVDERHDAAKGAPVEGGRSRGRWQAAELPTVPVVFVSVVVVVVALLLPVVSDPVSGEAVPRVAVAAMTVWAALALGRRRLARARHLARAAASPSVRTHRYLRLGRSLVLFPPGDVPEAEPVAIVPLHRAPRWLPAGGTTDVHGGDAPEPLLVPFVADRPLWPRARTTKLDLRNRDHRTRLTLLPAPPPHPAGDGPAFGGQRVSGRG